ncbi:MAG: pantoate--beta-alanine ligase [Planctomycetes bacterium]|nr:pantoate--beta-alanine ligase [Planctomycetota bacterium]
MRIVEHARSLEPFHRGALVPTMGALHAGHASLVERAAASRLPVVVTIFVNPTQFAPGEDFARYPRTLEADQELCRKAGAHAIFIPAVEELYPHGVAAAGAEAAAMVLPDVATRPGLEDAHRPAHFAGVLQIVAKLFDLCRPVAAYFGEKDFQQLRAVQEMVRLASGRWPDLAVHACPTIREPDGLAMSSRNRYLKPVQRKSALGLSKALGAADAMAQSGGDPAAVEGEMRRVLQGHGLVIDYAAVRSSETLLPLKEIRRGSRALVAARLEGVRLIDNAAIDPGG